MNGECIRDERLQAMFMLMDLDQPECNLSLYSAARCVLKRDPLWKTLRCSAAFFLSLGVIRLQFVNRSNKITIANLHHGWHWFTAD